MFKLDKQIIGFIYEQCKTLGCAFGYGALEGMIIYIGAITAGILELLKVKK